MDHSHRLWHDLYRYVRLIQGSPSRLTWKAVAYSHAPDFDIRWIQKWPGRPQSERHNKVDTAVSYDIRTGQLRAWGFSCDVDDDEQEVNQYWKLNLDPTYRGHEGEISTKLAAKWYRDYLSCLREHTIDFLNGSFPRFEQKNIEWVFSVPTVSAVDTFTIFPAVERVVRPLPSPLDKRLRLCDHGESSCPHGAQVTHPQRVSKVSPRSIDSITRLGYYVVASDLDPTTDVPKVWCVLSNSVTDMARSRHAHRD
jgi:hypothetical protein